MSWAVAALVAPLMSGFVIDHWGAEWLWGICAVVGTVAAAGYWGLMRGLPDDADEAPVAQESSVAPAARVDADAGAV